MIKDYIIKEIIGKGTYGTVYKVQEKNTNNIYALKQISLEGLSPKEISEVNQEIKILSSIKSDFVVKYYNSFEEKNIINIIMEYCDGGDLNDFLKEKKNEGKKLDEDLIWKIFIKITIGLGDIHKKNILHRDLKTLNIFLTKSLEIKIGDLGVAKVLSKGSLAKTVIGTPYYLSPEICEEKPYNDKSDVWALGCILYELCTFKHPFEARSQGALILKILNRKPDPIDSRYSVDLSNLIDLLLDKKSENRPTCEEILKYKVLNKVKSFDLYEYIKKLDSNKNDLNSYNNNIKISKKILDLNNINIANKYYSKNNSKDNIHKNININNFQENQKNKKQVSAINLIDNIKNNNLKFNNINQKIIHKKKTSEIKINVITIGEIKNQKPLSSVMRENQNKKNLMKYNNFFMNNNKKKNKNEKIESVVISKKNNKINKEENSNINGKKVGIIHPVKIIFKPSDEIPFKEMKKLNNYFRPKNIILSANKKENENLKIENDLKKEKKIKDNNIKKYIQKYKFPQKDNAYKNSQIKIKQIPDNNYNQQKEKENGDNISTTKSDKYADSINKKKENETEIRNISNNNKKHNIIISDNNKNQPFKNPKKNLISFLQKTNNEDKVSITKDSNKIINKKISIIDDNKKISIIKDKKSNDSISINEEKIIFSENLDSPNFQIINNNNLPKVGGKNNIDNNKFQLTNESGDSIDENVKKEKDYSNKKSNEIEIVDINNSDEEEENVEEIKENKVMNKEINILKEKIEKNKSELKQLMGEKDFKYIMNIHNIKEPNKIDEIYEKIEDFAHQKYSSDKNEKFLDLYLSLISNECQLDKKIEELKK